MDAAIYGELTPWYLLLDPPEDHEEDAELYAAIAAERIARTPRTLLELGSGAGNNGRHLRRRFECTLSDLSEEMLALSRGANPGCVHVHEDMRSLRLERSFDVVLIHDAISYMTTREDLRAAAQTAFVHTSPGGVAIFAPDCFRDTFREHTQLHERDEGERSLRCIEWFWDPDPSDETCCTEYALLLRDGAEMRAVHDRHVFGLFDESTWLQILEDVGFRVEVVKRPVPDEPHPYTDELLVGIR